MATTTMLQWIRWAGGGSILLGAILIAMAVGIWPFPLFGLVAWMKGARGGAIVSLAGVVASLAAAVPCATFLGWTPPEDATTENRQIRYLYRRVPQLRSFVRLLQGASFVGFAAAIFAGARVDGLRSRAS